MVIPTLRVAFAVAVTSAIVLVVYRLYLSPLSRFPGRKFAIATMWYEFYYQVVKRGQYPWIVQKMHAEYGKNLGWRAKYALNKNRTNHQDQSS